MPGNAAHGEKGHSAEMPRCGGFSLEGLKSAAYRFKKFGSLDRQAGSGRRRTLITPEATDAAKAYFEGGGVATSGEAASEMGAPKTNMRRMIIDDIDLKPLRKVTTQRVCPHNVAKMLELCEIRDGGIRNGSLDVEKSTLQAIKFPDSGHVPAGIETLLSGRRII